MSNENVITPLELLELHKNDFTKTEYGQLKILLSDPENKISAKLLLVDMKEWVDNYKKKNPL